MIYLIMGIINLFILRVIFKLSFLSFCQSFKFSEFDKDILDLALNLLKLHRF